MTLSHILQEFITEESIKNLRAKELLLFLLGYAFNELGHFWSNLNQDKKLMLTNGLNKIVNDLLNSSARHLYVANKQNLAIVFQTVLNNFQSEKETITNLKLSFQQLIQLFLEILNQGLKVKANIQIFKSQNQQLKSLIHQIIQLKAQKYTLIGEEKNEQVAKQNQGEFLESKHNKPNLDGEKKKSAQDLCEICYCSLNSSFQQKQGEKETVKIGQCGHQYHRKCILQMMVHYMNENSSILYQGKESKRLQISQVYQDWLTSVKCPGYQKCFVHMNFSQIHAILLDNQGQNCSKYLQRLYQMAFNDYINSRSIMPFQQLSEYLSRKSSDKEYQQSFKEDSLFFCHTKGCNAIYEINKNQVKLNLANETRSHSLQNFTCLSCHQSYCLKCYSAIHPTMTCKEFAISSSYLPEDRQLEKFIKTLRRPYMKCPKCHFYVDNWRGCSTVTCRCGVRFCYKCGSTECPYAKCLKEIAKEGKINLEKEQK